MIARAVGLPSERCECSAAAAGWARLAARSRPSARGPDELLNAASGCRVRAPIRRRGGPRGGVSRKFIYAHPDLRAQIEQRARHHNRRATVAAAADGHATAASLRADLANAKAHNQRLRQQLQALEQRLSETLGRDVADELGPGSERPAELRRELQDAQAQIFELTESLTDAREELDAVREINRELLAERNRRAR